VDPGGAFVESNTLIMASYTIGFIEEVQ